MTDVVQRLEWESDTTRLVKLSGLPRAPTWPHNHTRSSRYYEQPGRTVSQVVIHHSAGPRRDGLDAPVKLADWIIKPPKYRSLGNGRARWIGGGRGWPGSPYTFVIPTRPDTADRRFVVYRIWDDDWITWHTKGQNKTAVSIVCCGNFRSRHNPGSSDAAPDSTAMTALESLVLGYLLPHYNLDTDALFTHADFGKPACPGDALEAWVKRQRGEKPVDHDRPWDGPMDERKLATWRQKQTALVALGFDPGPVDGMLGALTRTAIEAFQEYAKLQVDGIWGPLTERAMRVELARLAVA